jgi:hypothetical protein
LIYGRSFESLFAEIMHNGKQALAKRLKELPDIQASAASTFNRPASIARLKRRLIEETDHGSV